MPAGRPNKREWTEGAARAVGFIFNPAIQLDDHPTALCGCWLDEGKGQHTNETFDPLESLSDATKVALHLELNFDYRAPCILRIYYRSSFLDVNWYNTGKEEAYRRGVTKIAYQIGTQKKAH